MPVAMGGSINPQFFTQSRSYHLFKRLYAVHWVIDLKCVITMKKCFFFFLTNMLLTSASAKFKILVCF